jgi:hypothetical protein
MSRPRALAVASGGKDVALATAPVNVTHPNLVRRLAWDIPLKTSNVSSWTTGNMRVAFFRGTVPRSGGQ